ncbi:DUF3515 family protein [Granulicoccus sp. GXG6511]|uniref:DUF3515 family protein n=1 Tax=Granulicoccus sp. GXG6511 TaxID=3381351 RepID=UPI003D7C383B
MVRRHPAALLGAGSLALGLVACAGPVSITEPEVDPATRQLCERIVNELPRTVLNVPQRDTTGTISAAWGTPPITFKCGVPEPAAMATDTRCFDVNGVGWFAEEGEGGWLFTTIGREVRIELGVPSKYAPEADALVDVADAIKAHNIEHSPCL